MTKEFINLYDDLKSLEKSMLTTANLCDERKDLENKAVAVNLRHWAGVIQRTLNKHSPDQLELFT